MTADAHTYISNFTDSINYIQKLKSQVNFSDMEEGALPYILHKEYQLRENI